LAKGEKTGFLFEQGEQGKFTGISPGQSRDGVPGETGDAAVAFAKSLASGGAGSTWTEKAHEHYFGKP